ncbi:YolA family protein [Bacillus wiedmannii]|nr:YolA family protein [Bacillus wiedmannii]MCU5577833.1 YolA family protein [Bacillus wiedmannii]MDM5265026.1 YolA family protein [Bacillus wiedmannii]
MLKRMILGVSSLVVGATVGLATDVSAAPAPPLTSLKVVKVEFQIGGVEFIGANNLSTVKNHGGSYLSF